MRRCRIRVGWVCGPRPRMGERWAGPERWARLARGAESRSRGRLARGLAGRSWAERAGWAEPGAIPPVDSQGWVKGCRTWSVWQGFENRASMWRLRERANA